MSKLYADNCAACHRNDLKGQVGFPNLQAHIPFATHHIGYCVPLKELMTRHSTLNYGEPSACFIDAGQWSNFFATKPSVCTSDSKLNLPSKEPQCHKIF
ncbi:c-type cytochrome [Ruegeria conchae]|uniref:c-type cytochrome n=1 Tax=Ruegeria conchae TaxID=981384 RepID=UPI002D1E3F11|nr:c-type cytochrome [Ruegeria conchae]